MATGQYTDADAVSPPSAGRYTDADVLPEQSVGTAVKEFGHQMNPVSIAKGIWQTVSHPIDAAKAYLEAKQKMVTDAETALSKGDWTGFVRHMQTAALPIPGIDTAVEQASNKWDSGDKAGALGDAAALVAQTAIASQAPAIGRGLKATGAGIAAAAPDVAAGGAKVLAGEALAKVPGMEFPARIGLGYPGARQIGKGIGKFGEAFGESLSPTPAKASAAAPAAGAAAAETLADGSTVQDIARGQGIKSWKNATADQKAGAQSIFDKLKATEAVAPTSAAGAPPPSPTQSAPRAQPATAQAATPASAAPTVVSATPAETPPPEVVKTANRTFVKDSRPSAEDYTLMEVPTGKIDAGWSKEGPAFYIPPGGGGAEIGGRLARAQEFIQSGTPVEAPRVSMAENGRIAFEDGRHRFAAMRDAGDHTVGVMVPNEQVADFQSLSKPAQAPATSPAATPASEAPSVRSSPHQANIEAKAQRFVDATAQLFRDHPATANASMTPGTLRQALAAGGYIKNTEVFPDESWPMIQQGIANLKATRQTIRPPAGFSMGNMGTKF